MSDLFGVGGRGAARRSAVLLHGTMLAGMRAVALTIDAEAPTHSAPGHPKHSRARPASPAQWRIVASPRSTAEPAAARPPYCLPGSIQTGKCASCVLTKLPPQPKRILLSAAKV